MQYTKSIAIAATALLAAACGDAPSTTTGTAPAPTTMASPPAAPTAVLASADAPPAPAGATTGEATPASTTPIPADTTPAPAPTDTTPAPAPVDTTPVPAPAPAPVDTTTAPAPIPKPTRACTYTKDASGFFTLKSALSDYVVYLPASYDGTAPAPLVVGLHGCGDEAYNFATWGVNPLATRATQPHIGVSVGGQTAANNCWSMGADDAKVLAAIDDVTSCFWIDPARVVIAGYSSGGQLAYRVGMTNASRFAGILIENSGLYAAGSDENALMNGAAWKLPVAHRAHQSDTVFPLAQVQADWTALQARGFPVTTSVVAGDHSGTGTDWAEWLLPQAAGWKKP